VGVLRQVHQQAPGDRNLGRQARALGADRILLHLHHDRLPLAQDALDRARFVAVVAVAVDAFAPDVGDMEEGGALQADLDEGRLHAGQHPHHAAEIDVADDAAAVGALDVQFLHRALLQQGDAGFLRREVDQELFSHLSPRPLPMEGGDCGSAASGLHV
jgi:hypothetical protein